MFLRQRRTLKSGHLGMTDTYFSLFSIFIFLSAALLQSTTLVSNFHLKSIPIESCPSQNPRPFPSSSSSCPPNPLNSPPAPPPPEPPRSSTSTPSCPRVRLLPLPSLEVFEADTLRERTRAGEWACLNFFPFLFFYLLFPLLLFASSAFLLFFGYLFFAFFWDRETVLRAMSTCMAMCRSNSGRTQVIFFQRWGA